MPIIKWEPFFSDMDDFFNEGIAKPMRRMGNFMPAVDVYKKGDNIMVEMSLPDIDPEKVEVHLENDMLTVKGSTEKKSEVEEKDYYRKEVSHGSFYRSIGMPAHVNGDKIEASYEDGMLTIKAPLAKESKPKKINVKKGKSKKK